MLNSDFPQTPPVAHFHSWTNGNGRGVSVCLLCSRTGFIAVIHFSESQSVRGGQSVSVHLGNMVR
jgi:hypothetical protein